MNFNVTFSEPAETKMDVSFSESTQNENVDFGEFQTVHTGNSARIGWVTLLANAWVGENNRYSQVVSIEGVTKRSQVDLTPDVDQLAIFYEKDIAFVTENDDGVVTVYSIGDKPKNDYTIQVTITEVMV